MSFRFDDDKAYDIEVCGEMVSMLGKTLNEILGGITSEEGDMVVQMDSQEPMEDFVEITDA